MFGKKAKENGAVPETAAEQEQYRFANEYTLTAAEVRESQAAFLNHFMSAKRDQILGVLALIVFMIQLFIAPQTTTIVMVFCCVFLLLAPQFRYKQALKQTVKHMQKEYGKAEVDEKVEVENGMIYETKDGVKTAKDIRVDQVTGRTETANLFVLFVGDQKMVSLRKDSFTDGNAEDFRTFMKSHTKNKGMLRHWIITLVMAFVLLGGVASLLQIIMMMGA